MIKGVRNLHFFQSLSKRLVERLQLRHHSIIQVEASQHHIG